MMLEYLTYIASAAALVIGCIAGLCYARWTESTYWRPYILQAYKLGREAGKRKGVK